MQGGDERGGEPAPAGGAVRGLDDDEGEAGLAGAGADGHRVAALGVGDVPDPHAVAGQRIAGGRRGRGGRGRGRCGTVEACRCPPRRRRWLRRGEQQGAEAGQDAGEGHRGHRGREHAPRPQVASGGGWRVRREHGGGLSRPIAWSSARRKRSPLAGSSRATRMWSGSPSRPPGATCTRWRSRRAVSSVPSTPGSAAHRKLACERVTSRSRASSSSVSEARSAASAFTRRATMGVEERSASSAPATASSLTPRSGSSCPSSSSAPGPPSA